MTAHTRTANRAAGTFFPVAEHSTTSPVRLVVIGVAVALEALLVLGFVSSSLGLGYPPYPNPDPDLGRSTAPPSVAPAAIAAPQPWHAPTSEPAPDPAPAPREIGTRP